MKSIKIEGGYARGKWFVYYDRQSRSWWAYEQDADANDHVGHQIGDAIFEFSRSDVERRIDQITNRTRTPIAGY